jgi:hypothetical protein
MKTANEIVNYLTRYYQKRVGAVDENLLSEKVDDLVGDMGEFLAKRLQEDTPHKAVWKEFSQAPKDNAASIAGILEALFEAQPAVRDRVNGFMQKITALEVRESDHEFTPHHIESDLQHQAGGLVSDEGENSAILADHEVEKNPPAYLYDNERVGFESDRQAPSPQPFLVGENAQIIYMPTEKVRFPFMFMHLGRLTDTAKDLTLQEKQVIQEHLQSIRDQLMGMRTLDREQMANDFESIWEVAPDYANVLIESLQDNLDDLPVKARNFIIQMDTPLH